MNLGRLSINLLGLATNHASRISLRQPTRFLLLNPGTRCMSRVATSHDKLPTLDSELNTRVNTQGIVKFNQESNVRREDVLPLSEDDKKDFFRLNDLFTIEDLMKARIHFGHKDTMLNPHMRPYIFGKRLGVLIIDLNHTERLLKQALNVAAEIAYRGGIILFFHNSKQCGYIVEEAAKECGEYAYCRRWQNAAFTDSTKIYGSVTRLPDLIIFFTTLQWSKITHRAVTMSAKMMIPTIGICDSNSDPTLITYPVPGNDDSPQSIEMFANLFKTAVLRGKEKRKEITEKYGDSFYNKTLDCI